ncbi:MULTISPECIES: hypothetical protein [Streptomyces]|uniref:hypothetical protein n=1 Tax=Streptomyces TaxID=1883 RepID=UPI000FFE51FC|nr:MULTISPECIES: hypothetical protein [Streptomyces]
MTQPGPSHCSDPDAVVSPPEPKKLRNVLIAAVVLIAVLVVCAGIEWWPRDKGTDPEALCWGALSPAQAKPLLSTGKPATATETPTAANDAKCDVKTGPALQDTQFVMTLADGMPDSLTPPQGAQPLTGARTGWVTQAEARIGLADACAYKLRPDGGGQVYLILNTTIEVRKHFDWKSAVLVPRISRVLTEAAEGIERHYKCGTK